MPLTPERASELAKISHERRKARKREVLTLERVEAELGPLETVDDAMRRLDRLGLWISAGMLSGSQGGAAVRSIEVWLRGHETRLTERVVDDLQADVERLKAELTGRSVAVLG